MADEYQDLNWEGFKVPSPTDVFDTKIVELKRGKMADFKNEAYFNKLKKGNPEEVKAQGCLQIVCENGTTMEFPLPKDQIVMPSTDLGRFKRTYGSWPVVGLSVRTKMNDKGYKSIFLVER